MWLILDASVCVVVLLSVFISSRKGFVRSVIEMIGFVLAVYVAMTFSTPIAETVYDNLIEKKIVSVIQDEVSNTTENTVEKVWEILPDAFTDNAGHFGISKDSLNLSLSYEIQGGADSVAVTVSKKVIRPVLIQVIGGIISFLIFLIIVMVVYALARLLNKLFSFSLIGKLNRILGGIIGAVKGIIIAVVICNIIFLIVSFTANGFLIFTPKNIESSYIFKAILQIFR